MTTSTDQDISGYWSGRYGYQSWGHDVPYTAWLNLSGGRFTGTTLEPNTFAHPDLAELSADLEGSISGNRVSFLKVYHPGPGVHGETIRYEGFLSDDGMLISGSWVLIQDGIYVTGHFEMWRLKASNENNATTETEADIVIGTENPDL